MNFRYNIAHFEIRVIGLYLFRFWKILLKIKWANKWNIHDVARFAAWKRKSWRVGKSEKKWSKRIKVSRTRWRKASEK